MAPADDGSRAGIATALGSLAPAGVRTGWRCIDPNDVAALHPVEAEHVQRAVARRRHEFASGRALLRSLTGLDVAIPVLASRAPQLPPGWRGSLAHDRAVVVAAVSDAPHVAALGIDLEPATPLEADLVAAVLRPDEVGLDAHLAFVMKEATYKAWSGLGGRMLEHHDVRLSVGGSGFEATVLDEGARFNGWWAEAGGRLLALVVVSEPVSRPERR